MKASRSFRFILFFAICCGSTKHHNLLFCALIFCHFLENSSSIPVKFLLQYRFFPFLVGFVRYNGKKLRDKAKNC